MQSDYVIWHRLWRETDRKLDMHRRRVREGVEVLPASDFARWLRFSGILEVLQPYEQEHPFPIRPKELATKCNDLISECGEWFALHERSNTPRDPFVPRCELEAIHHQLSALVQQVASLPSPITISISPPLTATAELGEPAEPKLLVLQGGAS